MSMREKLGALEKLGKRALSLSRTPRMPSGGMQTGDMITVGQADWYRLIRLAKFAAGDNAKEKGKINREEVIP